MSYTMNVRVYVGWEIKSSNKWLQWKPSYYKMGEAFEKLGSKWRSNFGWTSLELAEKLHPVKSKLINVVKHGTPYDQDGNNVVHVVYIGVANDAIEECVDEEVYSAIKEAWLESKKSENELFDFIKANFDKVEIISELKLLKLLVCN